jgi:hypothetical protein
LGEGGTTESLVCGFGVGFCLGLDFFFWDLATVDAPSVDFLGFNFAMKMMLPGNLGRQRSKVCSRLECPN